MLQRDVFSYVCGTSYLSLCQSDSYHLGECVQRNSNKIIHEAKMINVSAVLISYLLKHISNPNSGIYYIFSAVIYMFQLTTGDLLAGLV